MKPVLITYTSKTGFTRKYAEWIGETVPCRIVPFEHLNDSDIGSCDITIYGAGIHAVHLQALSNFTKKVASLPDKRIVVFATG